MARTDRRGLPLSTTSDPAAEHYREGVDRLLSAWPGAVEGLQYWGRLHRRPSPCDRMAG